MHLRLEIGPRVPLRQLPGFVEQRVCPFEIVQPAQTAGRENAPADLKFGRGYRRADIQQSQTRAWLAAFDQRLGLKQAEAPVPIRWPPAGPAGAHLGCRVKEIAIPKEGQRLAI